MHTDARMQRVQRARVCVFCLETDDALYYEVSMVTFCGGNWGN